MKLNSALLCVSVHLLLLCVAPVRGGKVGQSGGVTPVQKVIQMLQSMLERGKDQKHGEAVEYAKFNQFCADKIPEKEGAIADADLKIGASKAAVQQSATEAEELAAEIAALDADIAAFEGDAKAATAVRRIERTDFEVKDQDYAESVDALRRAIPVVKAQLGKVPQQAPAALLDVLAMKKVPIPGAARDALEAFLATDPAVAEEEAQAAQVLQHDAAPGAQGGRGAAAELLEQASGAGEDEEGAVVGPPEASAYESRSQGILDMLQKLLDKFADEKDDATKREANARHTHELLMADLKNSIEVAQSSRDSKAQTRARKLQENAQAQGELRDTTETKAEDVAYKADLTVSCGQKAKDFEQRQELRAEELAVIQKTIGILSGGAVSGAAEKHLPSSSAAALLQPAAPSQRQASSGARPTSFAQLRAGELAASPARAGRVAAYLRAQGEKLKSKVLSAVAVRVTQDPFKKVKKMLNDLIVKLMEEANEEASHKGWCDEELAHNGKARTTKTEKVEALTAEVDQLNAEIAELGRQIAQHTQESARVSAAVAEATEMREEEKAKNQATILDAKQAQTAIAQALTVLQEFYAQAAESTALLEERQSQSQEPAEPLGEAYTGQQGAAQGVIGMLEVIASDFSRLLAETEAAEKKAQREYDKFNHDSQVSKAAENKDAEHKAARRQDAEQALNERTGDLEGTQKELDAALVYYEKLKPDCLDQGMSYEERVARRQEEIESLQQALKILNGEEIA